MFWLFYVFASNEMTFSLKISFERIEDLHVLLHDHFVLILIFLFRATKIQ